MEIKTGDELINDFFEELKKDQDYDGNIVSVLVELFEADKLTETNISNGIENLTRENEKN